MAFNVTVYMTDPGIKQVMVYDWSGTGTNWSVDYGQSGLGEYQETVINITGDKVVFSCSVESGYTFSRWVYRVGSTSANQNTESASAWMYEGNQDIYIRAESTGGGSSRPSYFSWTNSKVSGGVFNLTATEWNVLTANINAVRKYKGYSEIAFTTAISGVTQVTKEIYDEAASSINDLYYRLYGTMPLEYAIKGGAITALCLNNLQDYINQIT